MKRLTCEMCGGTDFVKTDGFLVCQSCGIKYTIEEAKKIEVTVYEQNTVIIGGESDKKAPLLKRAFMCLEDKEWAKAKSYFERVLEMDPECADAYIGLAMVAKQMASGWTCELFSDKNFAKAVQFSTKLIDKAKFLPLFEICVALNSSGHVLIPDRITVIPENAFFNCESLISVTIASSVTSIDSGAFQYCNNLISVAFAEGCKLTSIGDDAFSSCYKLTSITIPSSVTRMETRAFKNCANLSKITFMPSSSLTTIGENAFDGCKSIKEVEINSIETWCQIDFRNRYASPLDYGIQLYLNGKKLTELVIPKGVTKVSPYAFTYCHSIKSVTIPNSVRSIGKESFHHCRRLTTVIFEENSQLTSIGEQAFAYGEMTSIIIPGSVTLIGKKAFLYCSNLKHVTFEKGSQPITIYSEAFEKCPAKKRAFRSLKRTSRKSQINNTNNNKVFRLPSINFKKVFIIIAILLVVCLIAGSIYLHDPDYAYSLNTDGGLTFVRVRINTTSYSITVPSEHKGIPVTRIKRLYKLLDTEGYVERIKIPSSVIVIEPGAIHWNTPDLEKVVFEDPYGWYVTKTKGATSGIDLTLTDPEQNAVYLGDTYREYYWYKSN